MREGSFLTQFNHFLEELNKQLTLDKLGVIYYNLIQVKFLLITSIFLLILGNTVRYEENTFLQNEFH